MTVSILFSEPGSVARGAVIFIGPIPLLLGSGVFSFPVFLYAILLTVLGIRFFMK